MLSVRRDRLLLPISEVGWMVGNRCFFADLCTPAELQALVDRWQVVEYLQKELPYRKIHDLTGVSVTTIGRVARCLADGAGGYRTAIDRISH